MKVRLLVYLALVYQCMIEQWLCENVTTPKPKLNAFLR